MVIDHLFIGSCPSEINNQQKILAFYKGNNSLLWKKLQGNIPDKYVSIFGESQQLCHSCVYGIYS